jgi:hypothetical protein
MQIRQPPPNPTLWATGRIITVQMITDEKGDSLYAEGRCA